MRNTIFTHRWIPVLTVLITLLLVNRHEASAATLEEKIQRLKLGFQRFHIGVKLTPEQQKAAQGSLEPKAHPGTYKFRAESKSKAGGFFVVAAEDSHLILALYEQKEELDREGTKETIAELMVRFGDPTTTGHDRIIYWAYDDKGKITDKAYRKAKKKGEIKVLATIKFSSTEKIDPGSQDKEASGKSSCYTLISSPVLLKRFMDRQ